MGDEKYATTGLVPVHEQLIGHQKRLGVGARDLHEKLGVKKPFTQWFEQYTGKGDWRKDNDYSVFNLQVKNLDGGGRPGTDAAISIQMAEHIAMMTRTAKGREIREEFRKIRDERDALVVIEDPVERYPQLRAIRDLVTATAAAQLVAERAEQKAEAAEKRAVVAEQKADIALEDAHHMRVEEFMVKNGLYRQYPPSSYRRVSNWVGDFCQQHGLPVRKTSVVGKAWEAENSYPIDAIMAFLRYDQKCPRQVTLLRDAQGE